MSAKTTYLIDVGKVLTQGVYHEHDVLIFSFEDRGAAAKLIKEIAVAMEREDISTTMVTVTGVIYKREEQEARYSEFPKCKPQWMTR